MDPTETRVVSGIIEQTREGRFLWMEGKDGAYVYNDDNIALRLTKTTIIENSFAKHDITLQICNFEIDGVTHVGHVEIKDSYCHGKREAEPTFEQSSLAQLLDIIERSKPTNQLNPTREEVLSGVLHALNR